MKIFILLMLGFVYLSAEHKINGEFSTAILNLNTNTSDKGFKSENLSLSTISVKYQYDNDGLLVRINPFAMYYKTQSGNLIHNSNIELDYPNDILMFREFYVKQRIGNHHFGFGVLPFSNNSFIEYQDDYLKRGEGLSTLVEADLSNFFYMYNLEEDTMLKIGFGNYNWLPQIPRGDYIYEKNKESDIVWASIDHNGEKFKSYTQFIYTKGDYDGMTASNLYLLGTGFAYDDSENSGWTVYNILAFSYYKNNTGNEEIQRAIMGEHNIPWGTQYVYPDSFGFNNDSYYGWSNLFGIRKDFDWKYETFINYELFYASDNWFSLNNGTPYRGNLNTTYDVRNWSHSVSVGVRPAKDWLVKLTYTHVDYSNQTSKIGAPPEQVLLDTYIGDDKSNFDVIRFEIKYKF